MDLHIHIEERAGTVLATIDELPDCQGIGPDRETAIARLQRAVHAYIERPPPSPFATVRKRLAVRAAGI